MSRHKSLDEALRAMLAELELLQHRWILKGHDAVPCGLLEWAAWLEASTIDKSRIVKQEQVGPYFISTVFLGLNHRFTGDGPPLLFETMVFHGENVRGLDVEMARCSTWEEAEQQHARIRSLVFAIEGEAHETN
jgi:hypothetical protein